jgi:hypothetical protein
MLPQTKLDANQTHNHNGTKEDGRTCFLDSKVAGEGPSQF